MGNKSYSQGDQLNLSCLSEGGPELIYTWLLSGSLIDNNNSSTLIIDNVTTSDGGDYTCNVTNNAGYDTKTITVYSKLNEKLLTLDMVVIHFTLYDMPYYGWKIYNFKYGDMVNILFHHQLESKF